MFWKQPLFNINWILEALMNYCIPKSILNIASFTPKIITIKFEKYKKYTFIKLIIAYYVKFIEHAYCQKEKHIPKRNTFENLIFLLFHSKSQTLELYIISLFRYSYNKILNKYFKNIYACLV